MQKMNFRISNSGRYCSNHITQKWSNIISFMRELTLRAKDHATLGDEQPPAAVNASQAQAMRLAAIRLGSIRTQSI